MKTLKTNSSEERFPVKPETNKIKDNIAENGTRKLEDMTDKELKLFRRIFDFTSQSDMQKKFGITSTVYHEAIAKLRDEGHVLEKDEAYCRSIITADPAKSPGKNHETPSGLISYFANTLSEEERREIMQLYEEGVNPVEMMEHLILIQSTRVVRGTELEQNSPHLHKTSNEAAADLANMLDKLHNMKEGQKTILGLDDSFVGIMQRLNKQNKDREVDNEW